MLCRTISRSFCSAVSPRPWLFVGLGNPGPKYQATRHNVGFDMIDAFAQSQGISMDTVHCKAFFGQGLVGGVPVFLAKPQTYMNLSGESDKVIRLVLSGGGWEKHVPMEDWIMGGELRELLAGPLAAYYKLPLNRVVVMFDDMNLPCGVLRLNQGGGHGSHNGLKSVIHHFRGNQDFARLRIGIGRPPGQMDPKAFVLQNFNATARERINTALQEGADALKLLVTRGLTESARCFNKEQKYKHIRVQTLKI